MTALLTETVLAVQSIGPTPIATSAIILPQGSQLAQITFPSLPAADLSDATQELTVTSEFSPDGTHWLPGPGFTWSGDPQTALPPSLGVSIGPAFWGFQVRAWLSSLSGLSTDALAEVF